MKVKLTEEQYSRLLTENTGDEWGRVSKTVDAFTIKVFKQIRDKIQNGGLKMNSDILLGVFFWGSLVTLKRDLN